MTTEFLYKTNLMKTWSKLNSNLKDFDTAYRRVLLKTMDDDFSVLFLVKNVDNHTVKMATVRGNLTIIHVSIK